MRELENEEMSKYCQFIQLCQRCEPHRQNFGKVYTPKSDIFELSEENEDFQKKAEESFDEKRVLGGWG